MKTLKFIVLAMALLIAGSMQGQISVNVNFGTPPQWGPVGYSDDGYSDVRYYYLPDVEAYYDVQTARFIYYNGSGWIHRTYLPARYRDYDLYNGYKVVMTDYRGNTPYTHHREYRTKYARGYRGQQQRSIGQRPGRGNSHVENRSYGNSHRVNRSNGNDNRNNRQSYQRNTQRSGGNYQEHSKGNNQGHNKQEHGNGNQGHGNGNNHR